MTSFLTGMLGALFCVTLLLLGAAGGWLARGRVHPNRPREDHRARRRLQEEQQAFATLQNYSPERAYGLLREEGLHG